MTKYPVVGNRPSLCYSHNPIRKPPICQLAKLRCHDFCTENKRGSMCWLIQKTDAIHTNEQVLTLVPGADIPPSYTKGSVLAEVP